MRVLAAALVCVATAAAADPLPANTAPAATPAPTTTTAPGATPAPTTTTAPGATTPPTRTASPSATPPTTITPPSATPAAAPSAAPAPDAFEACKAHRRELTADAMKVADPDARARLLLAMPTCRRFEDGHTEIVPAPPPELPDTRPFARISGMVLAGFGANTVISSHELAPTGVGPLVEADLDYRPNRRNSVALYASLARFQADDVVRTYGDGPLVTSFVVPHVTDTLFGVGVRGRRHTGRWAIALGVGAVIEQYNEAMDEHTTNVLRSIDAQLTCELASTRHMAADLAVALGDAGHVTSTERELLTARLLLGLRF